MEIDEMKLLLEAVRGRAFDPRTITKVMEELGVDHAGLGLVCGVSAATVKRWEDGKVIPWGRHLMSLSTLAGIELKSMFIEQSELPQQPARPPTKIQDAKRLILERLGSGPCDRRELIAAVQGESGSGQATVKRALTGLLSARLVVSDALAGASWNTKAVRLNE